MGEKFLATHIPEAKKFSVFLNNMEDTQKKLLYLKIAKRRWKSFNIAREDLELLTNKG